MNITTYCVSLLSSVHAPLWLQAHVLMHEHAWLCVLCLVLQSTVCPLPHHGLGTTTTKGQKLHVAKPSMLVALTLEQRLCAVSYPLKRNLTLSTLWPQVPSNFRPPQTLHHCVTSHPKDKKCHSSLRKALNATREKKHHPLTPTQGLCWHRRRVQAETAWGSWVPRQEVLWQGPQPLRCNHTGSARGS